MNFLMRSTTGVYGERSPSIPVPEPRVDTHHRSASAGSTLERRVPDDPYAQYDAKVDYSTLQNKHFDVAEEEGWITIPCSMFLLHVLLYCLILFFVDLIRLFCVETEFWTWLWNLIPVWFKFIDVWPCHLLTDSCMSAQDSCPFRTKLRCDFLGVCLCCSPIRIEISPP